jgi:anti-sigma-K factor RskA
VEQAKAYIESGILELYVLGQLNGQQTSEVEAMASKYPEIIQEIRVIEIALEQYALDNAVEPRTGLDKEIIAKLKRRFKASDTVGEVTPAPQQKVSAKIRNLVYALAACIALLLVATVALISANSRLSEAKQQISALNLQNRKFAATVGFMKQTNSDLQKIADMIDDPNWAIVKLAGTRVQPSSKMMVYWNKKNKNVILDKSKMVLPENDPEHQYQLWALVNGKPVDLGVFDMKVDSASLLLKMKEIPLAQAFAVTLEKRGGSPSPTMEQMVVMGGVTI